MGAPTRLLCMCGPGAREARCSRASARSLVRRAVRCDEPRTLAPSYAAHRHDARTPTPRLHGATPPHAARLPAERPKRNEKQKRHHEARRGEARRGGAAQLICISTAICTYPARRPGPQTYLAACGRTAGGRARGVPGPRRDHAMSHSHPPLSDIDVRRLTAPRGRASGRLSPPAISLARRAAGRSFARSPPCAALRREME